MTDGGIASTISGRPEYVHDTNWPEVATAATLGQPVGVAVVGREVVVFHRGLGEPSPYRSDDVVVFLDAATGQRLRSWGGNFFIQPHGLHVDTDGNIWTTDIVRHQVFKFDPTGKLLLTLGEEGTPGGDRTHFNQPTDVAVGPAGNIYVTDGYGNRRIVKFDPAGNYLGEWGREGSGPGELINPHAIIVTPTAHLLVADRENNRLQEFDLEGNFVAEFSFAAPVYASAIPNDGGPIHATDYLIEPGDSIRGSAIYRGRGTTRQVLVSRDDSPEAEPCRYHDLAVDDDGALYLPDLTNRVVHKYVPRQR